MYFEDEKRTLKRENELDFIKDIFIDYNFTVNNIELITKSEKVLNELDKNSLNLSNIKFNELELIQKAINRNEGRSTKAITSIRIERLMKCAIEECKNNIKVRQLINLAVNKKHYRNVENIKWYLDPIVNALKCKKIELDMRDEQFIKSELFYLEMDNINRYKWILQSYLLLLNCRKKQLYEDDIKETLNNVNTKEELITKIVKYLKRHSYFKEDKVISTLDELFSCIDLLINKDKLDIIDFSILENNFNEFKSNQELIEAIKEFPTINSNNIKDEYQLPKDELKNIIKDIHDITNRLKKLSSEQLSDYDEIMYFRRIIIIINEKYYDKVSKEIEELSLSIFRSIDKDNCYDDDLYIYIAINIQIIKDNVNNQKAYTPNDSR